MTDPTPLYDVPCGIEGQFLVGAAGVTATTLVGDDQKVEISIENTVAEWNSRGNKVMTARVTGQKIGLSATIVKNNMGAGFLMLQAAAQSGTEIAIKALDKVSGYGIDGDFVVSSWKEGQDKDSNDSIDASFNLSQLYRAPTFINADD